MCERFSLHTYEPSSRDLGGILYIQLFKLELEEKVILFICGCFLLLFQ